MYAINLMGPPTVTHKVLQVSLGLEHSYSEENIQLTGYNPSTLDRLNNVRRNTVYGKLGVGLLYNCEFFFRIGAATLKSSEIDFNGNTDPVLGWGTKVTF
jgi:hypothetical protein